VFGPEGEFYFRLAGQSLSTTQLSCTRQTFVFVVIFCMLYSMYWMHRLVLAGSLHRCPKTCGGAWIMFRTGRVSYLP